MKQELFIMRSKINTSAENAFAWHERPLALQRLTPPWQKIKILSNTKGIKTGTRIKMINYFSGFPVKLEAEHTDYKKGFFFQDRLVKSPFKSWVHSHSLIPVSETSSILEDKIEFTLPGWFPIFMKHLIKKELNRIFLYRHSIFVKDIERHGESKKPLTVLISGASGLIGKNLTAFLTTGGHKVYTLVRRKPDFSKNEIKWNPSNAELDLSFTDKIDVVINLNGAPLADGRWTEKSKKNIIQSRLLSTKLLAKKISELKEKPGLFFSASAIGYYGECGNKKVNEKATSGNLFISDVCKQWEEAASNAAENGIRTVTGRIGVVLTPAGGALEKMLPGFYSGLGARLGDGNQYMSFISIEDIIGSIWHIIQKKNIKGPVNLVAPEPVSNKKFTECMGKVISRPAILKIPASVIKLIWGKMGEEVLLSSVRVQPEKLINSGYKFCHADIETALRTVLGKLR